MNNLTEFTEFVKWTHLHNPLIVMVKDKGSSHYGNFWILDSNDNINGKYLTVEKLYEFWLTHPDWVEQVVKQRL